LRHSIRVIQFRPRDEYISNKQRNNLGKKMNTAININRFTVRTLMAGALLLAGQTALALGFEKPEYTVVYAEGDIEYRQYEPYLVSESVVVAEDGDFKNAGMEGVDRILAYIRGDNRTVADSAENEKISMTLPIEQSMAADGWRVSLKLPSRYTRETAPVPNDARVRIRAVPGRLMAVLRYSGRWTEKNFSGRMADLSNAIETRAVEAIGEIEMALYNPPITPPFMRRNEVMIEIRNLPEAAADQVSIRQAAR
jgi:hypothetical protein